MQLCVTTFFYFEKLSFYLRYTCPYLCSIKMKLTSCSQKNRFLGSQKIQKVVVLSTLHLPVPLQYENEINKSFTEK